MSSSLFICSVCGTARLYHSSRWARGDKTKVRLGRTARRVASAGCCQMKYHLSSLHTGTSMSTAIGPPGPNTREKLTEFLEQPTDLGLQTKSNGVVALFCSCLFLWDSRYLLNLPGCASPYRPLRLPRTWLLSIVAPPVPLLCTSSHVAATKGS